MSPRREENIEALDYAIAHLRYLARRLGDADLLQTCADLDSRRVKLQDAVGEALAEAETTLARAESRWAWVGRRE